MPGVPAPRCAQCQKFVSRNTATCPGCAGKITPPPLPPQAPAARKPDFSLPSVFTNVTFTHPGGGVTPKAPLPPAGPEALEVTQQDDLIRGVKTAYLSTDGPGNRIFTPEVVFRGMGYGSQYKTESWAECLRTGFGDYPEHPVPSEDFNLCRCGFWLPSDITGVVSSRSAWLLEVELAGRVIKHSRGWRGQWQRVLSVQPALWCCSCSMTVPATHVAVAGGNLIPVCAAHAGNAAIPRPLTWLRSMLGGAEVKPGFVSDDAAPQPAAALIPDLEKVLREAAQAAAGSAAAIAVTPGLIPGRSWKHFIPSTPPMVLDVAVIDGGLVLTLAEADAGGGTGTIKWVETLPI